MLVFWGPLAGLPGLYPEPWARPLLTGEFETKASIWDWRLGSILGMRYQELHDAILASKRPWRMAGGQLDLCGSEGQADTESEDKPLPCSVCGIDCPPYGALHRAWHYLLTPLPTPCLRRRSNPMCPPRVAGAPRTRRARAQAPSAYVPLPTPHCLQGSCRRARGSVSRADGRRLPKPVQCMRCPARQRGHCCCDRSIARITDSSL